MAGAVWNGVWQLLELLSAAVDGKRGAVLSEVWEAHAGKRTFLQRERDEPVTAQRQPPALRAAEKQQCALPLQSRGLIERSAKMMRVRTANRRRLHPPSLVLQFGRLMEWVGLVP